jgi:hypothetical protein
MYNCSFESSLSSLLCITLERVNILTVLGFIEGPFLKGSPHIIKNYILHDKNCKTDICLGTIRPVAIKTLLVSF